MEGIGSGSGNGIDGSSAVTTKLRAIGICLDRKLLNGIRVWKRQRCVEVGILILSAIQGIHVGACDPAVNGITRRASALIEGAGADGTGNQYLQLEHVSTVQR